MKKFLLLSLLVTALFKAGFGQCIPAISYGSPGVCPVWTAFPCMERGRSYFATLHFENWDSVGGILIQSMRLDSLTNIPNGINYSVNPSSGIMSSGGTACAEFTGVSTDTVGSYKMGIYVTLTLAGLGSFSGELGEIVDNLINFLILDTSTTALPDFDYFLRVINPGDPCPRTGSCRSAKSLVTGTVFFDANGNGVYDGGDNPMENTRVDFAPFSMVRYTNGLGNFGAFLDSGNYTISVGVPSYYSISTPASSYNVVLGNTRTDIAGNDFGLIPNTVVHDVAISLTSTIARPGFQTTHWIHYQNLGTVVENGTITYYHHPDLSVLQSTPTHTTHTGNMYTWDFANLYPGEQEVIQLRLQVAQNVDLLGDTLISSAGISIPSLEKSDTTMQIVRGSYDPNDKQVHPDNMKNGVPPGKLLTYTVRFQNTGTDTAFTVVIRDTLDNLLDASSFKTIASSHPYNFELEGNKYCTWTFENILLADSGTNEPLSHGFVKYALAVKSNATQDARVKNSASIYFDFNPAVKTNTVESRVDLTSGIRNHEVIETSLFPNPTSGAFTLLLSKPLSNFELQILDISGKVIQTRTRLQGDKISLDVKGMDNGVYLYQVVKENIAIAKGKLTVLK